MKILKKIKSKFTTMSKERDINIEDGNVEEQTHNEQVSNEQEQNTHAADNQSDKNAGAENESDSDADKKTEDNNAADKKAEETELDPLEKAQKEVEDLKKQLLYRLLSLKTIANALSKRKQNWYSMVEKKQFQPFCLYSMILSVPLLIRVKTLRLSKKVFR